MLPVPMTRETFLRHHHGRIYADPGPSRALSYNEHNNYKQFHHLAELGFLLQVNLLSLTGYYGKEAAKVAQYIIKNDLASFRHRSFITNATSMH